MTSPLPHTTTPCHMPPHIYICVCVWPQCLWLNVCVWLKYVYVWWVGEGWVGEYQSNLLSSTIPYPKISKVICHQVPYTPKRYQSNFSSSTIPLKNISICFKVPYPPKIQSNLLSSTLPPKISNKFVINNCNLCPHKIKHTPQQIIIVIFSKVPYLLKTIELIYHQVPCTPKNIKVIHCKVKYPPPHKISK